MSSTLPISNAMFSKYLKVVNRAVRYSPLMVRMANRMAYTLFFWTASLFQQSTSASAGDALPARLNSLNVAGTENLEPLYLWVPLSTKQRFLDMCKNENVSIHEMLARWAEARARPLAVQDGSTDPSGTNTNRQPLTPFEQSLNSAAEDLPWKQKIRQKRATNATMNATETQDRNDGKHARVVGGQGDIGDAPSPMSAGALSNHNNLRYLLDLPRAHIKLLQEVSAKDRPLLVTWTNGETKYLNLALNLANSIRKNAPTLLKRFVCVGLDRAAYRTMQRKKYYAVHHQAIDLKDAIWKMRWLILRTLSHLGIDGLVLDSDIVVLQDPFRSLQRDSDFEVMTDHFWPERHLWQFWVRPEDNINTGFIFVRASEHASSFLFDFLDEHSNASFGSIPRHWMDQQVFNKYVIRRMFHSPEDDIHCFYKYQMYRNSKPQAIKQRPIKIRIVDPTVVAHGMNYFWLRVQDAPGSTQRPVVAHANGVDGKEYFLRDRGLWYLDDFEHRFSGESFLTYDHPRLLSLQDDFELLAAALVVAVALRRRLVLPRTMNCQNCPALRAFDASHVASGDCTFDYFAWSQAFLGHHGEHVAEAGLESEPRFRRLKRHMLKPDEEGRRMLREMAQKVQSSRFAVDKLRVLHISDIWSAYFLIIGEGFDISRVFECKHHDWPVAWMACRDQRFVAFQGEFAKCGPSPLQPGCGYRGITCCETFWGWGEKLEYFTGKPWDLPCNCGIRGCSTSAGEISEVCCRHRNRTASAARCDKPINMERAPAVNTPEDTHTYTSSALADLEKPGSGPDVFWRSCQLNRRLRFADIDLAEVAWRCHRLASRYLLLRNDLRALSEWCQFAQAVRRPAVATTFPIRRTLAADSGKLDNDLSSISASKLAHDLSQLRYNVKSDSTAETVKAYSSLLDALLNVGAGTAREQQILDSFERISKSFNRAVHVPRCVNSHPGTVLQEVVRRSFIEGMANGNRYAVQDEVLHERLLHDVAEWLASATIWHAEATPPGFSHVQSSSNGVGSSTTALRTLQAVLLDGLGCCDILLRIAMELQFILADLYKDMPYALEGMWAWKFGETRSSEIWLWKYGNVSLPAAGTSSPLEFGTGRVFVCLNIALPRVARSLSGGIVLHALDGDRNALDLKIAARHNRLVMWQGDQLQGKLFSGEDASTGSETLWDADFAHVEFSRVDVVFAFGRSLGKRNFPGLTQGLEVAWGSDPV